VPVVADVPGDRDDIAQLAELEVGGNERLAAASVDHEPPAAAGERPGQGQAEAS
jgi:hypothetical protein